MRKSNNKGFTLVELIVVIAILGIIMLIAVPKVATVMQRQKVKADIITAQQIGNAIRNWYIDEKYDRSKDVDSGKKTVEDFEKAIPDADKVTPIKCADLNKIENVISSIDEPQSFYPDGKIATNPYYGVYLTKLGLAASIVITIQDDNSTTLFFGEGEGKIKANEVGYDGTKAGIAYVE